MAIRYDDIMRAQAERIDAEQQLAAADLEAARVTDDPHGVQYAAERILNLDVQRQALAARAQSYMSAQAAHQAQGNKFGLSQDELDVANSSFSDLPPEERQRIYAENRAKYQHMRATGQYRDDQGSVRR